MSQHVRLLSDALLDFMWMWDPYGIEGDRMEVPHQYDDWAAELVKFSQPDLDIGKMDDYLLRRLEAEGLNVEFGRGVGSRLSDFLSRVDQRF
jgi:hypothetical protein